MLKFIAKGKDISVTYKFNSNYNFKGNRNFMSFE